MPNAASSYTSEEQQTSQCAPSQSDERDAGEGSGSSCIHPSASTSQASGVSKAATSSCTGGNIPDDARARHERAAPGSLEYGHSQDLGSVQGSPDYCSQSDGEASTSRGGPWCTGGCPSCCALQAPKPAPPIIRPYGAAWQELDHNKLEWSAIREKYF